MADEEPRALQQSLLPLLGESLDRNPVSELYRRARRLETPARFVDFLRFLTRFRQYSIFNALLLHVQDEAARHVATAVGWERLHRRVIPEARALLLLAPRSPVVFVYELRDTVGHPLPERLLAGPQRAAEVPESVLSFTLKNCERRGVRYRESAEAPASLGRARAQRWSSDQRGSDEPHFRVVARPQANASERYETLLREAAGIFLGHGGSGRRDPWPDRQALPEATRDVEREAVVYVVRARAGLADEPPPGLLEPLSLLPSPAEADVHFIVRCAGLLERMGTRLLEP